MCSITFKVKVSGPDGWIYEISEFEEEASDFSEIDVLPYADSIAISHDLDPDEIEVDSWVVDVS
jgi:hypothetical protein